MNLGPKFDRCRAVADKRVCEVSVACDAWSNCLQYAPKSNPEPKKGVGAKCKPQPHFSIGFTHPPLSKTLPHLRPPPPRRPRGILGEYFRWVHGAPDVWVGCGRSRGPLCEVWGSVWTNSFAPWDIKAEKRSAALPPLPLHLSHVVHATAKLTRHRQNKEHAVALNVRRSG